VRVLPALALALALATAARLPAAWESGNALNHVSGTWMTLADDLARGTLYRPVAAEGAWGGTRYFPLAFALQAGLLRLGAPALAAAYGASLGAGLLLAAGIFLLLRGGGARRAALFAPLALAGFAGQHALSAGRGDLLPVALSALGLAALARGPTPGRVAAAAALLSLAFAAKPTALTAAAAAVAFLALRAQRRAALALAALVAAGAAAVVAATERLSSGRFLPGLRAVGAGGAGLEDALRAPVRLAQELAVGDPAGLVLALAGAAALAASLPPLLARGPAVPARRQADRVPPRVADPRLLPALWLAAAWTGALAVLASPGTGVNHLVELEAASAVLLGAAAVAPGRAGAVARAGAPAAALAGIALVAALLREDLATSRLAEVRAVVRALPAGKVLSEDPLVPLLAGERPALLDAFSLRLTAARDPALLGALAGALRRGELAAVVLLEDPGSPAADAWFGQGNLGLPLAREIAAGYRRRAAIGRYRLYVPRDGREVVGSAGAR
jgi:hypothetical protein